MEPIYREYGFELRAADAGDGLTLEGYAAVFNSPTRISGWEGQFTETVARGAFKKTLSERTPILMFNHGKHPVIGDMPIGAVTHAREDSHGVFVRARLADNWMIAPVRDSIANGSVSGMSFRFEPVRDKWNSSKTERTLLEVRVPEFGPVVMPAYPDTQVSVRSVEVAAMLDDPEVRTDLAVWLMRESEEATTALDSDAAREGTSDDEPPAQDTEPAAATPDPESDRAARLRVAHALKQKEWNKQ